MLRTPLHLVSSFAGYHADGANTFLDFHIVKKLVAFYGLR